MQAIYFDLDGTLADLYGVAAWCERLNAEDVTPYEEAQPLVSPGQMRRVLLPLASAGVTLGVISWGAMNASNAYNRATRKAKLEWCKRYLPGCFTEFHVVKYGTPKHHVRRIADSILVDDSAEVRNAWDGRTIDASNTAQMMIELQKLVDTLARI